MHTRMQAVEVLHPAVRILTLPPIVIGVTLLLMYALEGFLTLRELLVCELFLLLIPIAAYPLQAILPIRLLSPRDTAEQKNAQGGPTDDPENLRLHLDHRYGAAAVVSRCLRRVCSSMSQKRYSIIYSSITGK